MIRITIEFNSGWYEYTKRFLEEGTIYGLKSYKVEIIDDIGNITCTLKKEDEAK